MSSSSEMEIALELDRQSLTDPDEQLHYHVAVTGTYSPGSDARPCSDHDHWAFAEPGEGADFDITKTVIESVTDDNDEVVPEGDPRRLSEIELTDAEDQAAIQQAEDDYVPYTREDYERDQEDSRPRGC